MTDQETAVVLVGALGLFTLVVYLMYMHLRIQQLEDEGEMLRKHLGVYIRKIPEHRRIEADSKATND